MKCRKMGLNAPVVFGLRSQNRWPTRSLAENAIVVSRPRFKSLEPKLIKGEEKLIDKAENDSFFEGMSELLQGDKIVLTIGGEE